MLFVGFRSHHDLRFFEKLVNTSVVCIHQGKKSVQKVQKCCNLQGVGTATGNNCVNTSVSASKSGQNTAIYSVRRFLDIPKFFVNTSIFCDQLAKQAVIYMFFLCFQKHWYLQCFYISGLKSIGIYSIFCVFACFVHCSRKSL